MGRVSTEGGTTPLTREGIKEILIPLLEGEGIAKAAPYLLSMIALENGNGSDIIHHNWGNIVTSDPTNEHYIKGDNPRLFLSFPSHLEGANAFLRRLETPTHKRILIAALEDNFDEFFRGIHDLNQETGRAYNYLPEGDPDRAVALKAYSQLVNTFKGLPSKLHPPSSSKKAPKDGAGLFALALLVSAIGGTFYASKHPSLKKWFK
jgi:hypothetical protein